MSRLFSADEIKLNLANLLSGTADPTAGGGVARAISSLYARAQAGSVGLYQKTGAAATAWEKMAQSLGWTSVRDFGAAGDGVADDTAPIQNAINQVNGQSGGVVYFPRGTYLVSQISMAGMNAVQLCGCGAGSVLKWSFNAGGAAGSMLTASAGTQRLVIDSLRFDGSGLTNPAASRANHLLSLSGAITECHITQCFFGGMIASSGDGVHVVGTAGNLVARLWVRDNDFDGCSRFGIGGEQGFQYVWLIDNYMANCETEIGLVSTANLNSDSIQVARNQIVHSGAVRHAMRFEGDPAGLITKLLVRENLVIGGFVTMSGIQYGELNENTVISGAFASTDPVVRVFGGFSDSLICTNQIDRDPAASAGTCLTIESSGGVAPTRFGVERNQFTQQVTGAGFIKVVDGTNFAIEDNKCRGTNAGATTVHAIDLQAVAVGLDVALVESNQITAAAGVYASAVRLLANGANVGGVSIVDNQANQIDVGARFEVGGGGGNFTTSQIMFGDNNLAAATSDFANVGGAGVVPRIGGNATPVIGTQYFEGTGSPEGAVTARAGSLYSNQSGGQAVSFFYKETGTGNVGWLGVGGSSLVYGTNDTTTVATAVFLGTGFIATSPAAEIQMAATRPGTIRNLRVQVAGAGTGSQTVTYTVRKNGADTALLTTINNTATGSATDLTHSFTVAAGDLLSVSVVKAGVVAAGQTGVTAAMEMV
jgi:Pectate lyase superfamily protein